MNKGQDGILSVLPFLFYLNVEYPLFTDSFINLAVSWILSVLDAGLSWQGPFCLRGQLGKCEKINFMVDKAFNMK